MEICANCEKPIGNLERACAWRNVVVCEPCRAKLNRGQDIFPAGLKLSVAALPLANLAFGLFMAVAVVLSLINGPAWIFNNVCPPSQFINTIGLMMVLPALALLIFKRCRGWSGAMLVWISLLVGQLVWLDCLISVEVLWGRVGVILGALFLGLGIIPMSLLALLFAGHFLDCATTLLIVIIVLAFRFGGLALCMNRVELMEANT